ncbi:MAG: metallophosphoesterase, partial [Bryobacteraceae bacterium]
GYDVTIAGHTHGGQVTVEILHQHVNVARFFTPYVYGLYRKGDTALYVTRGIGTVGVPLRVGAPPEIALLRLCDT